MPPPALPASAPYIPGLLDVMEAGLDRAEPSANLVARVEQLEADKAQAQVDFDAHTHATPTTPPAPGDCSVM